MHNFYNTKKILDILSPVISSHHLTSIKSANALKLS